MPELDAPELESPSRFALLKGLLRADRLKVLLTKSSASRGLERYRRAGITASSSFVTKALNVLISFLSVPLTVHYLGSGTLRCVAHDQQPAHLDVDDGFRPGRERPGECSGRGQRERGSRWGAALRGVGILGPHGGEVVRDYRHGNLSPYTLAASVSGLRGNLYPRTAAHLRSDARYSWCFDFPLSISIRSTARTRTVFWPISGGLQGNSLTLLALVVVSQTRGGLPQLVLALSGTRAAVSLANYFFLFRRYHWLKPSPLAVRWRASSACFRWAASTW